MDDVPGTVSYLTDGLPGRYSKARVAIDEGEQIQRAHSALFQPAVILTNRRIVTVRPRGREPQVTSIDLAQIRDVTTSLQEPIFYWIAVGLSVFYGVVGGLILISWALLTRRLKIKYESAARLDAKLLLHIPKPSSWVDAIYELRGN